MAGTGFLKKVKAPPPDEGDGKRDDDKSHLAGGGHDDANWLISYADMMTLLCGFFIMLFSMAKLDEPHYEGFKEALAKEFGGEYTKPPSHETAKFLTQVLTEAGLAKEALVQSDVTGVSITFSSTVFFDTLSSDVTAKGKEILNKLVDGVMSRQKMENKKYKVVVEGHSDSRPIISGPYATNWDLSAARAARVVRIFLGKDFNAHNLTAIAYADTYPAMPARKPSGDFDEEALAKNRRVVIRILEPKTDSIPFPEPAAAAKTLTPPEPIKQETSAATGASR